MTHVFQNDGQQPRASWKKNDEMFLFPNPQMHFKLNEGNWWKFCFPKEFSSHLENYGQLSNLT